jgi:hypothetical protein
MSINCPNWLILAIKKAIALIDTLFGGLGFIPFHFFVLIVGFFALTGYLLF